MFVSVWTFSLLQHCGAKQLIVESSLREMRRAVWSQSVMWMCLFLSSFHWFGHGRHISPSDSMCLVFGTALQLKHVSTLVVKDKIWGGMKKTNWESKCRKGSWRGHTSSQDFDQMTNENTSEGENIGFAYHYRGATVLCGVTSRLLRSVMWPPWQVGHKRAIVFQQWVKTWQ